MKARHYLRSLSCTLLIIAAAAPAAAKKPAQTSERYTPPSYSGHQISLAEAVDLTMRHAPGIWLARESVESQRGVVQAATGFFDASFRFQPVISYTQTELVQTEIQREIDSREALELIRDSFAQLRDEMQEELDRNPTEILVLDCPELFTPDAGTSRFILDTPDGRIVFECTANDNLRVRILRQIRLLLRDFPPPEETVDLLNDILYQQRQVIETLRDFGATTSEEFRIARIDVGDLPRDQRRQRAVFTLALNKPFRNGMSIRPEIMLEGTSDNFVGKEEEAKFGGKGTENLYNATYLLNLQIPLGKGLGRRTAAAAEQSARLSHEASLRSLEHTHSLNALGTSIAYWGLVGSQEELELLRRSAATQRSLEEMGRALVQADEIPRAEIARVQARVSFAEAAVHQAEQALLSSRLSLARAIGLLVDEEGQAPLAGDELPSPKEGVSFLQQADQLIAQAPNKRKDLEAARLTQESSRVLLRASQADLRRRFDLLLSAGYRTLHEEKPEQNNLTDLDGWVDAASGRLVGPSARVLLNVDFPIKNNVARGRLTESEAIWRQSVIQSRDLERVIDSSTNDLVGELRAVLDEIGSREQSAGHYRETMQAAVERFRAGEASLIDTILTEERLTFSLIDLVRARTTYATLLTRLKFEAGILLEEGERRLPRSARERNSTAEFLAP